MSQTPFQFNFGGGISTPQDPLPSTLSHLPGPAQSTLLSLLPYPTIPQLTPSPPFTLVPGYTSLYRVIPPDVDALTGERNVDIVPSKYEGGAKVWECTLDLLAYLDTPAIGTTSPPPLVGARVLDLGCGAGLLGIRALQLGASSLTLQDLNASVLTGITALNVVKSLGEGVADSGRATLMCGSWEGMVAGGGGDPAAVGHLQGGYDRILSSETLYRPSSYPLLVTLLTTLLRPGGVALFATKRFYFGAELGGGSQLFMDACIQGGLLAAKVKELEDGTSMTRDIIRVTHREK